MARWLSKVEYMRDLRHSRPSRATTKLEINVILRIHLPIYSAQSVNLFIVDKMTFGKNTQPNESDTARICLKREWVFTVKLRKVFSLSYACFRFDDWTNTPMYRISYAHSTVRVYIM